MEGPTGGEQVAVRVACLPARSEPSHRSEMVTQWLLGEPLAVVERTDEWARCRGPDGYEGWCSRGGLIAPPDPAGWGRRATARSLGGLATGEGLEAGRLWLPFGARVAPDENGAYRLPDGTVMPSSDGTAIVRAEERPRRFPRRPEAVVASARRWLGVSYLWGGRTEAGVDCSGLVQSVFALHGVALPRDSGLQSRVGPRVGAEGSGELPDCRPGDLLFFGRPVTEPERGEASAGEGDAFRVTHVALATSGTGILHAADANGQVAEDDLAGGSPLTERLRTKLLLVRRPLAGAEPADPTEGT